VVWAAAKDLCSRPETDARVTFDWNTIQPLGKPQRLFFVEKLTSMRPSASRRCIASACSKRLTIALGRGNLVVGRFGSGWHPFGNRLIGRGIRLRASTLRVAQAAKIYFEDERFLSLARMLVVGHPPVHGRFVDQRVLRQPIGKCGGRVTTNGQFSFGCCRF
jgi:hypothetical protein